jgi:hypothetical protein
MSIAGIGFLGMAMTGAVMLIADFIYSPTLTIVTGLIAIGVYALIWYVLPLIGPRGPTPRRSAELASPAGRTTRQPEQPRLDGDKRLL